MYYVPFSPFLCLLFLIAIIHYHMEEQLACNGDEKILSMVLWKGIEEPVCSLKCQLLSLGHWRSRRYEGDVGICLSTPRSDFFYTVTQSGTLGAP